MTPESERFQVGELHQSPEISSSERLILYQENPFIDPKIKNAILSQYASLPDKSTDHRSPDREGVRRLFEQFIFDAGLNRNYSIPTKVYTAINKCDPHFRKKDRNIDAVKLYDRNTFIRIAKGKIISGKHVGFINFDLKNIRQADNAGYAEHLLRQFSAILLEVCRDYQVDPEAISGRVGGDEFSLFFSSDRSITEKEMEKIYDQVKKRYKDFKAYIAGEDLESTPEDQIKKGGHSFQVRKVKESELKEEKRTRRLVVPEGRDEIETQRKVLIHALQSGQMPDGEILARESRVGGKAFEDSQKQETKTMTDRFDLNSDRFQTEINNFFKKHPEFSKQRKLIEKLQKTHPVLTRALSISLIDYLTDPLLEEDVYQLPDFLNYLTHIKTPGTIIRYTNPFTKCFNAEYLYSGTNEIIRDTYGLVKKITHHEGGVRPIYCRTGGDILVFIPQKMHKAEMITLPLLPSFKEKEKERFKHGFPLFCSTVEFSPEKVKSRKGMRQLVKNIDDQNSMLFIHWLNELFKNKKTFMSAKNILDLYFSQRTEERLSNLIYWMVRLIDKKQASSGLYSYILSRSRQLPLESKNQTTL